MSGLREHLDMHSGMTNELLRRMAFLLLRGGENASNFAGVFCYDSIPPELTAWTRFSFIANLGKSDGHFVCVYGNKDCVLYIDPYGRKCDDTDIMTFLRACNRRLLYVKKRIQHSKSVHCGLFSLLFLTYLATRPIFKMSFHKSGKDLMKNDAKCVMYLQRIVRNMNFL